MLKLTNGINFYKLRNINLSFSIYTDHLLEPTKGQEFMKAFVNLLKTNLNLRGYFKNLVNVNSSCNKSMQLIVKNIKSKISQL